MFKMKRKKFNSDFSGDIVIIGFTGNNNEIHKWLKKNLKVKIEDDFLKKEKYKINDEKMDEIIKHIETYPLYTNQDKDIIKDRLKNLK